MSNALFTIIMHEWFCIPTQKIFILPPKSFTCIVRFIKLCTQFVYFSSMTSGFCIDRIKFTGCIATLCFPFINSLIKLPLSLLSLSSNSLCLENNMH